MTGAEFKGIRERANVSRAAVAAFIGTQEQNLRTFEKGYVKRPTWDVLSAARWLNAESVVSRADYLNHIEARLQRARAIAREHHQEFDPFVVIKAERLALEISG